MVARFLSFLIKPWISIYGLIRGDRVVQTREQTIAHLLWFYFMSVGISFSLAAIQVWSIPSRLGISIATSKILLPLVSFVAAKFGFDFLKDFITTEFDAAMQRMRREIERETESKFQQEIEDLESQIKGLRAKERLDFKYLAYIKSTTEGRGFGLKGVDQSLKERFSDNPEKFKIDLEDEYESAKLNQAVRCVIHDLPENFLQWLAVKGILDGLSLSPYADLNRINYPEGDLYSLRVDIYAYLSAWLICSIDNDSELLMDIHPIGMTYKGVDGIPDKSTYEKVIRSIQNIIISKQYTKSSDYPKSDPLELTSCRETIGNYLEKLIEKIDDYANSMKSESRKPKAN